MRASYRIASSGSSLFRAASCLRSMASISTEIRGTPSSESFRVFFRAGDSVLSPWHDVPLRADDGGYNMITEIPKMTKAKMEIATKEEHNPIAQDTKKGKLREYHGPIFWNYGCLPQTWENPNEFHPELKVKGDNDPIDVVEIGSQALTVGSVTSVKALGVLAMIDDGELDWKVIAIASNDPLASSLTDIDDVEAKLPGVVSGVREWFRWYKTPDEKPLNEFGFDEKCLGRERAEEIIEETHSAWNGLRKGEIESEALWK